MRKIKIRQRDYDGWLEVERQLGESGCCVCPIAYNDGDGNACDALYEKQCPLVKAGFVKGASE